MDVGSTITGFSFAALSAHFIDSNFVMRNTSPVSRIRTYFLCNEYSCDKDEMQCHVGPLVESALRFKQTYVTKPAVNIGEGLPPFGSFNSELLELNDDCISNISDENDEGGDDVSSLLDELDEFYDHIPGAATSQDQQVQQDHTYMEVEIV